MAAIRSEARDLTGCYFSFLLPKKMASDEDPSRSGLHHLSRPIPCPPNGSLYSLKMVQVVNRHGERRYPRLF